MSNRKSLWTVGLTGGIGSGKSAVAERFRGHGVAIIDTDCIAHELTRVGGQALVPIGQHLGPLLGPQWQNHDGSLNRTWVRQHVFSNPKLRKQLEAILHPMIGQEVDRQLQPDALTAPYAVLVVPLLFETPGYPERCQRTLGVDCPPDLQVERVSRRNGLTQQEIRAIIKVQMSREERNLRADDLIDNSSSLEELSYQVDQLHRKYLLMAQSVK